MGTSRMNSHKTKTRSADLHSIQARAFTPYSASICSRGYRRITSADSGTVKMLPQLLQVIERSVDALNPLLADATRAITFSLPQSAAGQSAHATVILSFLVLRTLLACIIADLQHSI